MLHKPPRGFRDLTGFSNPRFVDDVPFKLRTARKGAKAEGVRYERKVQPYLGSVFDGKYVPNPWIAFDQGDKTRHCQPDGLIIDPRAGRITIVEVKLRHTMRAYWQLCRVYYPLISQMFPSNIWEYSLVEIVKWYDGAEPFPGEHKLQQSIDQGYDYNCTQTVGVHILWPIPVI